MNYVYFVVLYILQFVFHYLIHQNLQFIDLTLTECAYNICPVVLITVLVATVFRLQFFTFHSSWQCRKLHS